LFIYIDYGLQRGGPEPERGVIGSAKGFAGDRHDREQNSPPMRVEKMISSQGNARFN
jgi:hypothetical protein